MPTYSETVLFSVEIYLLKVNNKNTRKQCEKYPELTTTTKKTTTQERRQLT